MESSVTFNRYEILPSSRLIHEQNAEAWKTDYIYGLGFSAGLEEKVSAERHKRLSLIGGLAVHHFDILPVCTFDNRVNRNIDILSQAGTIQFYRYETENGVQVLRQNEIPIANNIQYQNLGIYTEVAWEFYDNYKAIAGVRLDRETRIDTYSFSPRFALIGKPLPNLTLKYIFTRAFVAPPVSFTYRVFDDGSIINIPNPDLEPETALSNEFNAIWTPRDITAGFSFYYNTQQNLFVEGERKLTPNVVAPIIFLSPNSSSDTRRLVQYANIGNSSSYGLDIYANAKISILSLWASYSLTSFSSLKTAKLESDKRTNSTLPIQIPQYRFKFHNVSLTTTIPPETSRNEIKRN